jgi:5-methyltetrahydrofolate--homocysteine methyltransferase
MTHTVVSSDKKEVVIGFDRPFCIIGERINPTGRKKLAAEMAEGNFSTVEADAVAETIKLVQSLVDVPLSIDSSIVEALEAGLAVYKGKPLVNSVTGEEERLEVVLPLIKKYGAAVVAISNDETGISEDPDVRYEVAKKIVERAADFGIPRADVVVDPLVMPVGALGNAGVAAFRLIRRLRDELGVNTTCGASNISFGLPNRHALNAMFLAMASGAGMTSAIMNPLHLEEVTAIMGADVMNGVDLNCARWLRRFRQPAPEGAEGGRGGRERRRRRA